MSQVLYRCVRCGHISRERFGRWWHTTFDRNWFGSARECRVRWFSPRSLGITK